ncbi:uracil-DNA glycosylase family protein [Agaribacter marinus]|uniref:Uracil-DNA glycosylase n=1 Tax=Agaribacter marinus TaxID=1431249 RepID=A0AA37WJQ6_9ALTE|nr:uracil-DNA glycosylase [Agaribacter marinus]
MAKIDIQAHDISNALKAVRDCTQCTNLPLGPRPILQVDPTAKILIAGQAPGRVTHHKGIPFDDPSGNRLRDWMGIDRDTFYNEKHIAILPMAFCYPGTEKNGDLPPPPQCAEIWRKQLLVKLPNIRLTLLIGKYALDWHLSRNQAKTLTETVKGWEAYWPSMLPMPHPSPRNNRWLKNNPWFSDQVLPRLKQQVSLLL